MGVFLNPFAKVYQKLPITVCDGTINFRLIRVPMISVMFFAMLSGLPKISNVHYCIHLFTIPSQSIIGKILPNLCQRRLKTSIDIIILSVKSVRLWRMLCWYKIVQQESVLMSLAKSETLMRLGCLKQNTNNTLGKPRKCFETKRIISP